MPETTATLISASPIGLKETLLKIMCNIKCSCFLTFLYIVNFFFRRKLAYCFFLFSFFFLRRERTLISCQVLISTLAMPTFIAHSCFFPLTLTPTTTTTIPPTPKICKCFPQQKKNSILSNWIMECDAYIRISISTGINHDVLVFPSHICLLRFRVEHSF